MIKLTRPLRFIFIVYLFSVSYLGFGKLIPAENSLLNYTSVYFEENFIKEATEYRLVLYSDSLFTHTVIQKNAKLPAFWVDNLNWGNSYYWKLLAFSTSGTQINESAVHKFGIMKLAYQGFDEIKVDVKTNKEAKHSGGIMSLDYSKSIIDRKGKQVWAIPSLPGVPADKMYIRDMRITQDNTITFLTFEVPYELDVDGKVVWKAPYPFILNKDTIHYHHDFKKTSRGTYMVLGDKFVYRSLLGNYSELEIKNSSGIKKINDTLYKRINITTLLEFNKSGELIWYWDANSYLEIGRAHV